MCACLNFCIKSVSLLVIITLVMGCATTHKVYTEVRSELCDQYKYHDIREGYCVAVSPIESAEESLELFQTDLLAHGILPVLVVLENRSAQGSIMIDQEAPDANATQFVNDKLGVSAGRIIGQSAFWLALVGPLGAALALPLLIPAAMEAARENKAQDDLFIRQSMARRALRNETLTAGEKQSGFLYCNPKNLSGELPVYVRIVNLKNKTTAAIPFTLQITLPKKETNE